MLEELEEIKSDVDFFKGSLINNLEIRSLYTNIRKVY